jgi:23S rRNA A1618 N6-methylase RlmF
MDPKELEVHNQKDVKAKRIILDEVKDHLIPHLSEKKLTRERFEALTNIFHRNNANRKMGLREKIRNTKMTKSNTMTSYLTKITQVRDQLAAVGEVVTDEEMVRTALNSFAKPWAPFINGIVARETLPKFDRLWDDFIQKEIQEQSLAGQQKGDDENLALASQTRKNKGKGSIKRNTSGESTSQAGKKRDLSKVKCFACHKSDHYASQCPE